MVGARSHDLWGTEIHGSMKLLLAAAASLQGAAALLHTAPDRPTMELVITRCRRGLGWLEHVLSLGYLDAVYLYDKCGLGTGDVGASFARHPGVRLVHTALPNVGREGHTHLTHMFRALLGGNMSEVAIFVQDEMQAPAGHLMAGVQKCLLHSTRRLTAPGCTAFFDEYRMPWPYWYKLAQEADGWCELLGRIADNSTCRLARPPGLLLGWHGEFMARRVDIARMLGDPTKSALLKELLERMRQVNDPPEGYALERLWRPLLLPDQYPKPGHH